MTPYSEHRDRSGEKRVANTTARCGRGDRRPVSAPPPGRTALPSSIAAQSVFTVASINFGATSISVVCQNGAPSTACVWTSWPASRN